MINTPLKPGDSVTITPEATGLGKSISGNVVSVETIMGRTIVGVQTASGYFSISNLSLLS